MFRKIVPLAAALFLVLPSAVGARGVKPPVPPAGAATSCTPSASITEYYFVTRTGTGTSQSLSTLTKPVVVSGSFADYHNAEAPCGKTDNNGDPACQQWEIPAMVIEGPNPLGSISDANVNTTLQMFDIRDGTTYSTYVIPSIDPSGFQYPNEPSPLWTLVSETMDGTCYKDTVSVTFIPDVLEESGSYALKANLCEHNNGECNETDEDRGGASTDEHWGVVAKDNTGLTSNIDVSAEIGEDSRGTCGIIGNVNGGGSGGWETISNSNNTTCPGDQNAN